MVREIVPTPTVLVVDDEALIRWALSERLSDSGYPVRTAATGAEARAILETRDGAPWIVLLDLRLPDVSDLSLLGEFRARWPDLPVVMMTAHGSAEDARQAALLGAARFVSKPFDVSAIVDLVGEVWRGSRP